MWGGPKEKKRESCYCMVCACRNMLGHLVNERGLILFQFVKFHSDNRRLLIFSAYLSKSILWFRDREKCHSYKKNCPLILTNCNTFSLLCIDNGVDTSFPTLVNIVMVGREAILSQVPSVRDIEWAGCSGRGAWLLSASADRLCPRTCSHTSCLLQMSCRPDTLSTCPFSEEPVRDKIRMNSWK